MTTPFAEALARVLGPSLVAAGFVQTPEGWVRSTAGGLTSLVAYEDGERCTGVWGWQYSRLGDPDPVPPNARGCLRRMALDELAPTRDLRPVTRYPGGAGAAELADWTSRTRIAWNRAVAPWLEKWRRPDGYRDFLSSRSLHLGAAWVSAELGHLERAAAELELAGPFVNQPLAAGFDRRRAEHDAALAAPFAVRHGLSAYLAEAERRRTTAVLDAFTSARGAAAVARVTAPDAEHTRLQQRLVVFAELCRRRVAAAGARA